MGKRTLLIGFSALVLSLASFAGTPDNMLIWLKNGEQRAFDINQVDSVTFGVTQQQEYQPLTENTMPPTFAAPNPLELSEQELAYVKSTNEFGKKCYSILRNTKDAGGEPMALHFFSPISLNIALGFCANGATNVGIKEITDALGFHSENALEDMNDFFQKIYLSLNSEVDSVTVRTANALWLNERSIANMDFVETAREKYYATVRNLDFMKDPGGSKDTIDHWAALMTNDCIKNLGIKIDGYTRLVINNACYFKGDWVTKFTPLAKMEFHGVKGDSDSTDFMAIEQESLEYSENDYYQAIKLDYGTKANKPSSSGWSQPSASNPSAYSMVVVLPKSGHDLDEVLPTLQWDSIPFQYMKGDLYMPKFKAKGGYPLKLVLKELNIEDMFKTGHYPNVVLEENVHIDQVQQDYFINVDEEGTEAAAVTSIVGAGGAVMSSFFMNCNRPFAFAIRENTTGLLLFMGEYNAVPKSGEN